LFDCAAAGDWVCEGDCCGTCEGECGTGGDECACGVGGVAVNGFAGVGVDADGTADFEGVAGVDVDGALGEV